jgi:hypothetical protein
MRSLLLAGLVFFSGCGGSFFQVQVEIERLCVTRADALSIPALPIGGALSVTGAVSAPTNSGADLELRFDSLELRNLRGASDFAFLDDASIFSARDQAEPLASLERSAEGAPPAVRLVATPDAAEAPASDRFDYLLSVSVNPLAAPVTADVEVCARVLGRYELQ